MHSVRGRHRIVTDLGRALRGPAVAIGNFDGVHLGHRALVEEAMRVARGSGGEPVALTFDPHPARFFAPALAPPMLSPLHRRIDLLQEAGAEVVIVEPFNDALAAMAAEDFIEKVLAKDLGARHVVVGADFSFGKDRHGNIDVLTKVAGRIGLGVSVVPQVTAQGLVCSSTKIREFVLEGRVEGAAMLLGRPFEIEGEIVHGAGRGRTLGIPTINVANAGEILPKPGVYAGRARRLEGDPAWLTAAISVGTNPTFSKPGDPELFVEAHLLDFSGDLYGATMRVAFVAHLREQRRYSNVDGLVAAIHSDIARTREICS